MEFYLKILLFCGFISNIQGQVVLTGTLSGLKSIRFIDFLRFEYIFCVMFKKRWPRVNMSFWQWMSLFVPPPSQQHIGKS